MQPTHFIHAKNAKSEHFRDNTLAACVCNFLQSIPMGESRVVSAAFLATGKEALPIQLRAALFSVARKMSMVIKTEVVKGQMGFTVHMLSKVSFYD